jgi:hypothetical protein
MAEKLEMGFDQLLYELSKGHTIERMKRGIKLIELEQVKEWKNRFGFSFQIFPNDHLIENKPHFHLIKNNGEINCKFFFDATLIKCLGIKSIDKETREALLYFTSKPNTQTNLKELWNKKNPNYLINVD